MTTCSKATSGMLSAFEDGHRAPGRWARAWVRLAALALVGLGCWAEPCGAQPCGTTCTTIVPAGTVNGTWTLAGSPYCIQGNIIVGDLTINPGVCVLVDGAYSIDVSVRLRVLGTLVRPVTITAKDPAVRWSGITFNDTGQGSVLNWCTISRSGNRAVTISNAGSAPPTFNDCTFQDNTFAGNGGGMRVIVAANQPLVMNRCTLAQNISNPANVGGAFVGGALWLTGAATLTGCTFNGNTCNASCDLIFCSATSKASSLYCDGAGAVQLQACAVLNGLVHTAAMGGGSGFSRGAIYYAGTGTLDLRNCLLACNASTGTSPSDGAIWVDSGVVTVTNCTIARNTYYGVQRNGGTVTVNNSILYFNNQTSAGPPAAYGPQFTGTVAFGCSDVQGGVQPGACPNISVGPGFYGTSCCVGDYTLFAASPCVDAGDPAINDGCRPAGLGAARSDMGAFGGAGNCDWGPSPRCAPDFNCDGHVTVQDIFDFLNAWFANDQRADFNGINGVEIQDIFDFLNAWFAGC